MTEKRALSDLAVLGGRPLFSSVRPIGQLSAPNVDDFLKLLRAAYDRRTLTGEGPIVRELERRLAEYHQTKHCITLANAGLGLIMLTQIFARGRTGEVIIPAFTYRGLPHIVQWAQQMPRFCDVDADSHTLTPETVAAGLSERTTCIMAVCNFNSPGDIDGLCALAAERRIPIIFDSVDALGSTYRKKPLGGNGNAEVFSTHATKMLNGFEGGYVTTNDDDLAATLRWQRDFALPECAPNVPDTVHVLGLGAQFNEVHAAMTLLSLDEIDSIIERNRERAMAYRSECAGLNGLTLLPYSDASGERSNYRMVVADVTPAWPLTRDETIALLRAEGAAIDAHWSPALHVSVHAPLGLDAPSLPVAEDLGRRMMHLPVGDLVSLEDIRQIGALLHFVQRHGAEIASKMRGVSVS